MPHEFEKQMQFFLDMVQLHGYDLEKLKTIKRELVALVQSPHQALQSLYHFPDQFVNLIPIIVLDGVDSVRQAVLFLSISYVEYDIKHVIESLIPIAQHFEDNDLWAEIKRFIANRIPDNDKHTAKLLKAAMSGIKTHRGGISL